jgi:hypothetical protein
MAISPSPPTSLHNMANAGIILSLMAFNSSVCLLSHAGALL